MSRGNGERQNWILRQLRFHNGAAWVSELPVANRGALNNLYRAVPGLEARGHVRVARLVPPGWKTRRCLYLLDPERWDLDPSVR